MDETLEERIDTNDISVVLVDDIKEDKGKDIFLTQLDSGSHYRLKVQITRTYGITYNQNFDVWELNQQIEKLKMLVKNNIMYYVAPVKEKED